MTKQFMNFYVVHVVSTQRKTQYNKSTKHTQCLLLAVHCKVHFYQYCISGVFKLICMLISLLKITKKRKRRKGKIKGQRKMKRKGQAHGYIGAPGDTPFSRMLVRTAFTLTSSKCLAYTFNNTAKVRSFGTEPFSSIALKSAIASSSRLF
jgi:hypothetical protein